MTDSQCLTDTAMRRSRAVLWSCLLALGAFVGWAAWAELDEVTRGDGRITPSGRLQTIQSLEGGILNTLYVSEGDLVEAGAPLLKVDDTHFRASYMETSEQVRTLSASIARLEAEVVGAEAVEFSEMLELSQDHILAETALFDARRQKLKQKTGSLGRQQRLVQKQLKLLRPLVKSQAVSEMEYLNLEKEIASLEGELLDLNRAYSQEAYTELSKKKGERARLEQILLQRLDQLSRTDIRSPVRGRVNNITITTRGGVIQPGEMIMDILPTDDHLLVETRIKPQDVAFLAPGMPATIKLTAYDYTMYGALKGEVLKIGVDSIEEETARGKEVFYKVLVATDASELVSGDQSLPMKPGMVAQVEILNGKRSVLSHLLKPVLRARLN